METLFLSTSTFCDSPNYFWTTWPSEVPSVDTPSSLCALTSLRLWLDIGHLSLGATKLYLYQLPLTLFLSTHPASISQPCKSNISVSGRSPHILRALFPRHCLTCDLSRGTHIYPIWWVLKTQTREKVSRISSFLPLNNDLVWRRVRQLSLSGRQREEENERKKERISLLTSKMLSHCSVSREVNICSLKNCCTGWDMIISSKFSRLLL